MCLQADLESHGHCTGQAVDGLLCKKPASGMSLPSPTPFTTPHWGPLQGGLPRGSHAPLRVGELGISPSVPQGLLPHCVRRDRKSSQEPQPGPAVSWETACSEDWIYEILSVSQPSL